MQRDDGVQDGETLRENRFDPLEQASQVYPHLKNRIFPIFSFLRLFFPPFPLVIVNDRGRYLKPNLGKHFF